MFQSWRDLLFAHWPISRNVLSPLVPDELEIEEFGGSAWVGITPFVLESLRAHYLPPVPGVSSFPELNLRTYVRVGDEQGIFFLTLEAGSLLAVAGARSSFRLPYRLARMRVAASDDWISFSSRRRFGQAEFVARYRPTGAPFHPAPGTLEHFLTERYALFVVLSGGRVLRGEIHHAPWSLQAAEAEITRNTLAVAHGILLPGEPQVLHFCRRQNTLIWPPKIERAKTSAENGDGPS